MAKAETLGQPPRGKHGWQIMAAALGVPAAIFAGWLYFGRDKGPTKVEENPNLPGAGLVLPEFTPTLVPLPTSTPEPTPTVEVDYVAEAMKRGKLELNGEVNDWEKYFVAVTPEEAEKLLEEANRGVTEESELKLLLPFDPREAPNLVIETYVGEFPGGIKFTLIGIKNLPPVITLYAPVGGEGRVKKNVAVGRTLLIDVRVKSGDTDYIINGRREEALDLILNRPPQVGIGTPLVSLENSGIIPEYNNLQVVYGTYRPGDNTNLNSISQLLRKKGKIAFIAQDKK